MGLIAASTPAWTGLLWGIIALGGGTAPQTQPSGVVVDSMVGPGDAVPYVAQTPLLCGGAAAAMVQRHLGARGVHGRDFAYLVRPDEGGIRTSELVEALTGRGYPTRVTRDDPGAARAALEVGLAPILLLESAGPELHYVVLVGMDSARVWYHDPNWGPNRSLPVDELVDRWSHSGFWMATTHGAPDVTARDIEAGRTSTPSEVDSAMALLRAGDFPAARDAVAPLRTTPHRDTTSEVGRLAWRITATAHYLDGDEASAVRAWNHLGEPPVDLVRIDGLRHTRYHAARRRIGVDDGEVLRPHDLMLARRRLASLPSIGDSRVSIQPLGDGDVELRAAVVERSRWPGGWESGAALGTALFLSEADVEVGPLFSGGDRWIARAAWHPARDLAVVEAAMPAPPMPGIVTVGLDWRSEVHAALPDRQERLRGELALSEWVVPSVRVEGSAGVESWSDGPRRFSLGGQIHWVPWGDRLRVDVGGARWTGDGSDFGRAQGSARVRLPLADHREARLRVGWSTVSESAPPLLRPGAGIGPFRDVLLRAHSVESEGSLGGPTLAPRLGHAGLELREYRRIGPVRVGGMVFADAVTVPGFEGALRSRGFVDVGLGAVLDMTGQEAQITLGHGEAGWRLSARLSSEAIR